MALGATVAMLLVLLPLGVAAAAAAAATGAGSSNCTRICGNISIPYPFGVESGCYHAGGGFNLTCNHSFHPPELFLGDGTVQVLDISIQHSTVRINSTGVELSYFDDPNYGQNATRTWGAGLPRDGPYYLSVSESTNMLQAIGCDIQVSILGGENNSSLSSCTALCPTLDLAHLRIVGNKSCSGIACCQASIVLGLSLYTIQINTLDSSPIIGTAPSVYIVDQTYHYDWGLFYGEGRPHALPATLNWVVNNSRCPTITAPECRSTNSYCQDFIAEAHGGYMCKCSQGYQGNPYIPGGCQDIDECKYPDTYICYGQCKNTPGSFICQCNTGYTGNSSHPNGCKGRSL